MMDKRLSEGKIDGGVTGERVICRSNGKYEVYFMVLLSVENCLIGISSRKKARHISTLGVNTKACRPVGLSNN